MYYDQETGVKSHLGLFSKLTVSVLALLVVSAGVYLGVDYFAPEIFAMRVDEKKSLETKVKTEEVSGEYDFLRIPSIGLERQVMNKSTEGKVQITVQGESIILSGRHRTLSITPYDTIILSPLALVGDLKEGQMIYLDYERERMAYEVESVGYKQKPNMSAGEDLVIYALSDDGSIAEVVVTAKKLGFVEVQT